MRALWVSRRAAALVALLAIALLVASAEEAVRNGGDAAAKDPGGPHGHADVTNLHSKEAATWHPDRFKRHGRADSCQRVESTPLNPRDLWCGAARRADGPQARESER